MARSAWPHTLKTYATWLHRSARDGRRGSSSMSARVEDPDVRRESPASHQSTHQEQAASLRAARLVCGKCRALVLCRKEVLAMRCLAPKATPVPGECGRPALHRNHHCRIGLGELPGGSGG